MTKYDPVSFWDDYAKRNFMSYNEPQNYLELDNLISLIVRLLPPDASVLDVGCGWGRFLKRCLDKGLDELRISMCEISQEYIKQCTVITGETPTWWNGRTLPYEDDSFDLVVSQSCMLHVKPYIIKRVWAEHVRVAKKYLYVATATPERTPERIKEDRKGDAFCFAHDYEKRIAESNLEIIEEKSFANGLRTSWLLSKKQFDAEPEELKF